MDSLSTPVPATGSNGYYRFLLARLTTFRNALGLLVDAADRPYCARHDRPSGPDYTCPLCFEELAAETLVLRREWNRAHRLTPVGIQPTHHQSAGDVVEHRAHLPGIGYRIAAGRWGL